MYVHRVAWLDCHLSTLHAQPLHYKYTVGWQNPIDLPAENTRQNLNGSTWSFDPEILPLKCYSTYSGPLFRKLLSMIPVASGIGRELIKVSG